MRFVLAIEFQFDNTVICESVNQVCREGTRGAGLINKISTAMKFSTKIWENIQTHKCVFE